MQESLQKGNTNMKKHEANRVRTCSILKANALAIFAFKAEASMGLKLFVVALFRHFGSRRGVREAFAVGVDNQVPGFE